MAEDQLAQLLERRPDVLLGVPPRDLADLAARLWLPQSLVTALRSQSVACLQVVEAAQALGGGCTRVELARFLAGDGPDHRSDVDQVVAELTACAVVAAGVAGRIELPDALADIFPSPLGLGQPLRVLLRDHSLGAMRRLQAALGLQKQQSRADTLTSLVDYFADTDNISAVLTSCPSELREYLTTLVIGGDPDDEPSYDPSRYEQRRAAIGWAAERGLMISGHFSYQWELPAEVSRALLGPGYRAPFTPRPPQPRTRRADPAVIEMDSAAAAAHFADQALAVLDHVVRLPVPCVKAGGIGSRELTKLAKATAAGEIETRLALELADAAGQLVPHGETVAVSDGFAEWRDLEPGDRFVALLTAWWGLGSTPTTTRDADGKVARVLARPGECGGCRAARVIAVETLAEFDAAIDRPSLASVALWKRPLVHVVDDRDDPFATVWHEAELLGVIAHGAITELGRLLLAGDAGELRAHAKRLLPAAAHRATFGADLTVYVAGAPTAQVSALLDSAADREGRGGAVTWRFSPASVRRALDEGITGAALTAALAAIATAELPQPLRYLVADVARRHGNLRLTSAATCIRSDDEALLAEVAADRKLAGLGLRLLAPTILAGDVPLLQTMVALRKSGYFPVSEDEETASLGLSAIRGRAGGEPTIRPASRAQIRELFPAPPRADARAVAAGLLRSRTAPTRPPDASPTERRLSRLAKTLSVAEIRQLAHAIDTQSRVGIVYQSATGGVSKRVIDQPELSGASLHAWCELRQDERIFTVTRIRSVTGV